MSYAQTHTLELINQGKRCENRSLLFSRFTDPGLRDDARRTFLANAITQKLDAAVLSGHCAEYNTFLNDVPGVLRVYAKNQARLLLNMSGGVLENAGCSLDRLTGLPRIPGSAIKGIARHAALDSLKSDPGNSPANMLADIALVFGWISADWKADADLAWACAGCLEEAKDIIKNRLGSFPDSFGGSVVFFDALPYRPLGSDLELDILTSHHTDYYAGKLDIATDTEDPIPVVFPAIAKGHTFGFAIAPCRSEGGELLGLAKQWLIDGITLYGVGAKTAAGYGWFTFDDGESNAILEHDKVEQLKVFLISEFTSWNEWNKIPPTLIAISACEKTLDSFKTRFSAIKTTMPNEQIITEAINRAKNELPPQATIDKIRDRWALQSEKAIINGEIRQFTKKTDEEKKAIVEILREQNNPIWQKLRSDQKGDIATAVDAIRAYCKNTLNLGRMP